MKNFLRKNRRKIIIAIIAVAALAILRGSEDDWICDDGEWVRHGVPSAPMPEEDCD
jgi:hypothetical protein